MRYTGEKPVDPLIVNVWPLKPGESSNYTVYEDSGKAVEYQRGVFALTPIRAVAAGDTLRVEIGPAEGSYPGMPAARGYELRLPADWPPVSVTVDGVPVDRSKGPGKAGWTFEGNTLTTVIPVSRGSVTGKVTVEVRRAPGLVTRRGELDGFSGAMNRLRGAYNAMNQTWPVAHPPGALIEAMQTGDRIGYHPELAVNEIGHFHERVRQAQAAIGAVGNNFEQEIQEFAKHMADSNWRPSDVEARKQARIGAFTRAKKLVSEAEK